MIRTSSTLLLAGLGLLLGCGAPQTADGPSPGVSAAPSAAASPAVSMAPSAAASPIQPIADGQVLRVEYTGGLCPDGACRSERIILRDGRYTVVATGQTYPPGTLPQADVDTLVAEIQKADFARIKSVPFTGTCPIAYDGPELIYHFATPQGPERIASCSVGIDENSPLFKAVKKLLDAIERDLNPTP